MIRPFELTDIATLHRYRQRGLFLESIPTLTWGRTLVPAAAYLSPLAAATGVFTSLYLDDDGETEPIVAQLAHSPGSPFARLTFVAPDSAIESPVLMPLLESLIKRVGERGAQSLVAEVNEKSHTFEVLRRNSFSIYTRQRIYKIEETGRTDGAPVWRPANPADELEVHKLYNGLVPALVQQVEPAPWGRLKGWVLYEDGELLAYADVASGPSGVWLQPFIHPELGQLDQRLAQLIHLLGPRSFRPVYVCLRSYAAWLQLPIEDLGGLPGPSQAVMVRRLAVKLPKPALATIPDMGGGTEPTTLFIELPPQESTSAEAWHVPERSFNGKV